MKSLYGIKRHASGDYCVYLKRTGKVYFYDESRAECEAWLERNDGDEHN